MGRAWCISSSTTSVAWGALVSALFHSGVSSIALSVGTPIWRLTTSIWPSGLTTQKSQSRAASLLFAPAQTPIDWPPMKVNSPFGPEGSGATSHLKRPALPTAVLIWSTFDCSVYMASLPLTKPACWLISSALSWRGVGAARYRLRRSACHCIAASELGLAAIVTLVGLSSLSKPAPPFIQSHGWRDCGVVSVHRP
jgi:hypothetical protein